MGIGLEQTQWLANKNAFLVNSQTKHGVKYLVDMNFGLCSGQDGSPCFGDKGIQEDYFYTEKRK